MLVFLDGVLQPVRARSKRLTSSKLSGGVVKLVFVSVNGVFMLEGLLIL